MRVGCRRNLQGTPTEGTIPKPMTEIKGSAGAISLIAEAQRLGLRYFLQIRGCEGVKTRILGSQDFTSPGITTGCRSDFMCAIGSARRQGWWQAGDFLWKVSCAHNHVLFVKYSLTKLKTLGIHMQIWVWGFS